MSKTYTEMIEEISTQEIDELYEYALLTEKNMSKDEVAELIDDAISAATKVKNDPKKSDKHKTTASSVLSKVRSIKKTFEKDVSDSTIVEDALLELCTEVSQSIGRMGRSARTVTLKLRWSNFDTITRQRTVPGEIHQAADIYKVAKALLYDNWKPGKPIRLMGVSASRLGVSDQQKLPLEFE